MRILQIIQFDQNMKDITGLTQIKLALIENGFKNQKDRPAEGLLGWKRGR